MSRLKKHPPIFYQTGLTIIELMVILIIVGILGTLGSRAFLGFQDSARLLSTTNEMRNIVNVLATIEKGLGGNVGGSWATTPAFPVSGTIALFNASSTIQLPASNPFGDEAEYSYTYSLTPSVSLSTLVPIDDAHPAGFLAVDATSTLSTTSTLLTVYPRAQVKKYYPKRQQWVKEFFYNQDYEALKQKQASGTFNPNYLLGTFR